jgi:hypothetical protein
MKKWIVLILSTILRPLLLKLSAANQNPIEEIKEFVLENALKACVGIIAAIAVGTMFTGGLLTAVIGYSLDYSGVGNSGLIVFLLSLGVIGTMLYFSKHDRKAKLKKHEREQAQNAQPSLEESITLLVNEFVKEREIKRVRKAQKEAMENARDRDLNESAEVGPTPFDRH